MARTTAILAGGLALVAGAAHAASKSSVYCQSGVPAIQFAGRIQADGSLFFGLSVWDRHGDNSFIQGNAKRQGNHWLYVAEKPEYDPSAAPCRLEVWYSERAGVRAKAASRTDCANHGWWNEVSLSRKSYQGPVTVELNDPSAFFEDPPGLLGKGDCFKQNPE